MASTKRKPTPKLQVVPPANSAKTAAKRLTLTIPAALYADLEVLADEQRRELRQQCLHILETAVKAAKGQKRTKAQREAIKRRWAGEE